MTSELAEILPLCRHTILNTLRYSNVSMIGATSSNSSVTSTAGDRDIITNDSTLSLAFDGGETVTRSVGSLFNTLFSYNTAASTTSSSTGSPSSCFAGRPSMYLKAEYDTEPGYDFFKLRVYSNLRQPNSTVQQIISVSGQNGTIDDWFPLQQFVGQEHLEIEIRFISDPAKTFGPIKIHQVVFSC